MSASEIKPRALTVAGMLTTIAICAFTGMPSHADMEAYQSDQIQEFHSDTIREQSAKKVEPVKAEQPEVFQADQPELFQADPVTKHEGQSIEPDQADTPSPRAQSGIAEYIAPPSWQSGVKEGTAIYLPRGLSGKDLCLIMVMPVVSQKGDFVNWFSTETQGKLGSDIKLVDASIIKKMTTRAGDTMLLSTRVTEKTTGGRMYVSYVGIHHGDSTQLIAYVTSSGDLFVKYLPEFQVFMQSLRITDQRTPGKAPKANPAPAKQDVDKPAAPKDNRPSPTRIGYRVKGGNAVEPLSNGVLLSMDASALTNKCGEPESDNRFSGGGLTYPDFRAVFNANDTEIWHFTINKGVTLNSGLGVGSTRADINAVFGSGTSVYGKTRVQYDQYIVTFAFDGDRVNEIKIEPARGAFTRYRAIAAR